MDAHFSKVLSTASDAPSLSKGAKDYVPFIPASKFEGRRQGYKFKNGSKGVGYYYDIVQIVAEQNGGEHHHVDEDLNSKKRKLGDQNGMW